jgi:hypothetical protein
MSLSAANVSPPQKGAVGLAEPEEVIRIDHRVALLTSWPVGPAPFLVGQGFCWTDADCDATSRRPGDHGLHLTDGVIFSLSGSIGIG